MTGTYTARTMKTVKAALNTNTRQNMVYTTSYIPEKSRRARAYIIAITFAGRGMVFRL